MIGAMEETKDAMKEYSRTRKIYKGKTRGIARLALHGKTVIFLYP